MLTNAEIDRRFDLHRPVDPDAHAAMDKIRAGYKRLAVLVADTAGTGREQSLAITALEESLFWAIGSIVRPEAPRPAYPPSKAGGL